MIERHFDDVRKFMVHCIINVIESRDGKLVRYSRWGRPSRTDEINLYASSLMLRIPPTAALEAFLATARGGTLKMASEEVNLSVSALSRRIQSLESYIGAQLFFRLHHQFRLTPVGERLLAGLSPAFDQLGLLMEELRDQQKYQVSVGVPTSFATAWLLPRLHKFRAKFPDVELRLDSSGSPVAKLGVSLDAIILFANKHDRQIGMHELRPQRAFAVAAPGLVDSRSGLANVLQEQALLLHSGLPEILPSWLREVGLKNVSPRRFEYYDDGPLILAAAQNRLGIALVLEDMINFYPRTSELHRPFGECAQTPYSYCLAIKPTSVSRAVKWFNDWLIDEAATDLREVSETFSATYGENALPLPSRSATLRAR
jgi:LysR family transcriptional regulator, glycine cleavage system transcriptional activator